MDDEAKQLLRDIRDAQLEQLEILRESHLQATEVNKQVLKSQATWNSQSKLTTKLMIAAVVVIALALLTLEVAKAIRPDAAIP
ncbi:MAG: hypothetical protein AAGE65_10405 [Planctomycetota bacterium]